MQAIALIVAAGCALTRGEHAGGVHPRGFDIAASPAFHGRALRANGFAMGSCQPCHGGDFSGGPVGVSCSGGSCHRTSPTACDTCHRSESGAAPMTGAHALHARFCDACHVVPARWDASEHIGAKELVRFDGIARAGGALPTWDGARCQNTWCHGASTPAWSSSSPLDCGGCHEQPPKSHARFARVLSSCASCHPVPPGARHVDGIVQVSAGCSTCHGSGPLGAPPVGLDGSTDPHARGVGAHTRHLEAALPDRIGRVAPCDACHDVPAAVGFGVHPAGGLTRVRLEAGSYDATSGTCVTACHFDRSVSWTDASGASRACDGCHGFPPVRTRKNTPHPSVEPTGAACRGCHPVDPGRHVDGVVDLL